MPRRRTTVFAKRPRPGAVKTRLCPPLAPGEAAALAEAMLADVLARCRACAAFETGLRFAPAGERAWFEQRFPGLADLAPQEGADLGERLARHFDERADGAGTEVALGADAPTLPVARVVAAHDLLEEGADLVLSPDLGGGYVLVGLRAPAPELFTQVAMSTGDMCARTLELARRRGLRARLLDPTPDVDTGADLARLERELASLAPDDPRYPNETAAALRDLRARSDAPGR